MLVPGDDARQYEVEPSPGGRGLMLRRKPDGSCFYLGAGGCTIHARAPTLCQLYDCRRQYSMLSRGERRKMIAQGLLDRAIMEEGRKRLHTLEGAST